MVYLIDKCGLLWIDCFWLCQTEQNRTDMTYHRYRKQCCACVARARCRRVATSSLLVWMDVCLVPERDSDMLVSKVHERHFLLS